jgi:class 3 adenylate cyclase
MAPRNFLRRAEATRRLQYRNRVPTDRIWSTVTAEASHRKLAAIMFTDMVGYSALAQRDDELALELLEEHRRLLREIFPRFHATEIKTIGDGFLVEFDSALDAAQCAIEIQGALSKRNADVPVERRIEIKMGVHIGDVVHRNGDVYGDGVNIASRIEPLAGAGGICVSMDVERQIRNTLEARFKKLSPLSRQMNRGNFLSGLKRRNVHKVVALASRAAHVSPQKGTISLGLP